MITIKEWFLSKIDQAGILEITYKLNTDTALNSSVLAGTPDTILHAYRPDGSFVASGTPFSANLNGEIVTAAAGADFTVSKEFVFLNYACGLPAETKLNVKAKVKFYANGITPSTAITKTTAHQTFTFEKLGSYWLANTGCYNPLTANWGALPSLAKNLMISTAGLIDQTTNLVATTHTAINANKASLSATWVSNFKYNAVRDWQDPTNFHFTLYESQTTYSYGTKTTISQNVDNANAWTTPMLLSSIDFDMAQFVIFNDVIIGTINTLKPSTMDLTKPEFKEIAKEALSISSTNHMRTEVLLLSISHNDPATEKKISLTNEAHQLCFIKKINLAIAADGTLFSLKINNVENAVTSQLQIVPEGIEGNYEAAGYFATEIILKGNITGQVIFYRATKL